ncbi:MAG: hypothetical protein COX15_00985 [Candidatus Colwellbacteria bacterium CG23_combo_of_CG06-09_8_20_14_all_42_19]|uniref:Uncharacterized protein n=1 Tax=Candidatus Colwellbacteria bacterium CG23_combo_of_CG06-09_8_20_14_all_42_19 TaxID=1974541 RepID=A0A2H0ANY9_9BACT|nr:MAG: hypothetical protein COX15_00985 [Candidatus Colwellbacteria bacterium CG23_combo_of_CG06-09_8_20_14_all_42_19]
MKEKIKKNIGEIMIIAGSGLFSCNVFNFSYQTFGKGGLLKMPGTEELEGIAYYYSSNSLILISIGVMLIVGGILIIRNRNYGKQN